MWIKNQINKSATDLFVFNQWAESFIKVHTRILVRFSSRDSNTVSKDILQDVCEGKINHQLFSGTKGDRSDHRICGCTTVYEDLT